MKLTTEQTLSKKIIAEKLSAYYELTKPGITLTVLASMLIGFILGSGTDLDFLLMLHAALGTWLIASGTAAHNQFMEWRHDEQMKRTRKRPLPESRLSTTESVIFSLGLIGAGLFYLLLMVNWVAGLVSLATTIIYLGAYTPLKRVSAANVLVGAVPGALPPVGGWAAATATLADPGMWILFAIVFFWQIPHVMAIAWVCKDDYRNAGFRMLPKNDEKGTVTSAIILACLVALLPVTWALYAVGLGGMLYLAGGLLCGLVFAYFGVIFAKERTKEAAKKLMFASFGYLPLVWIFIFLDRILA